MPRILCKFDFVCIYLKSHIMNQTRKKYDIPLHHQRRMEKIGTMLREIRFAEGLNQDEFIAQKGRELDLTVQLAIKLDDSGEVFKFNFEKGKIIP